MLRSFRLLLRFSSEAVCSLPGHVLVLGLICVVALALAFVRVIVLVLICGVIVLVPLFPRPIAVFVLAVPKEYQLVAREGCARASIFFVHVSSLSVSFAPSALVGEVPRENLQGPCKCRLVVALGPSNGSFPRVPLLR